jgi:hypothetical protein
VPERQSPPSLPGTLNRILERLRNVERISFKQAEQKDFSAFRSYSWQSTFSLVTGFGHRLFAERNGVVQFIRAERSSGDGTTTATFKVYLAGEDMFVVNPGPTVDAGERLGPECRPDPTFQADNAAFRRGDDFQVEITDTGGGTGPLRVTIYFIDAGPGYFETETDID